MENRSSYSSVDVVNALVRDSSPDALDALCERVTRRRHVSDAAPPRVDLGSSHTHRAIHWSGTKSMGTTPLAVPIIGDTLRLRSIAGSNLVTLQNRTSGGVQQLGHKSSIARWVGVLRVSTAVVERQSHPERPPLVEPLHCDIQYLASHVPVAANASNEADKEGAISFQLAVLMKKIVSWLLQSFAMSQSCCNGSARPYIPLDVLSSVFPELLLFEHSTRSSLLERAIEKYARGILSTFDSSVISLVDHAELTGMSLVTRAEARASLPLELALRSLASRASGRHLAEVFSSLEAVRRRLLIPSKVGDHTAFRCVAQIFCAALQVLAPVVNWSVKKETPWLAAAVRVIYSSFTYGEAPLLALQVANLAKKCATPDAYSALDMDLWLASIHFLTHRTSQCGSRKHGQKGQVVGDARPPQDWQPSAVLGNQASAFFSTLPSSPTEDTGIAEGEVDSTAKTASIPSRIFAQVEEHERGAAVAMFVSIHPGQLCCLAGMSDVDLEKHLAVDEGTTTQGDTPVGEDARQLLATVFSRWTKSGLRLTVSFDQICRSQTTRKDEELLIIADTPAHRKRRKARGAPPVMETPHEESPLDTDRETSALYAVRAKAARRRRLEPS